MANTTTIDFQLKEASQLTNAVWAALVEREAGKWRVITHYKLGKKLQTVLVKFLAKTEVDSWLCGALSGGQSRSVSLPKPNAMQAERLYAFPIRGMSRAVVVGAQQMDTSAQRIWRLAMASMNVEITSSDVSPASSVAASLLIPDLDSESPYDLLRSADRALMAFIRLVSVQGGWFAIRRGDALEVRAHWNAPSCADLLMSIDPHTLLRRMNRNLTPMAVNRGDPAWSQIPHKGLKSTTKAWISQPQKHGSAFRSLSVSA